MGDIFRNFGKKKTVPIENDDNNAFTLTCTKVSKVGDVIGQMTIGA